MRIEIAVLIDVLLLLEHMYHPLSCAHYYYAQ